MTKAVTTAEVPGRPRYLEVLAVSHYFPPTLNAQSIQVSRLLANLPARVTVACAEERIGPTDPSVLPNADAKIASVFRIPYGRTRLRRKIDRTAERLGLALWNIPDPQREWVAHLRRKLLPTLMRGSALPYDALITFGMPMSDHLLGLHIKRRHGVAWVAHFSDPWAGNAYTQENRVREWAAWQLERRVVETADGVVFTSPETLDFVMPRYPATWSEKAAVVLHSYDLTAFPAEAPPERNRYVIRSLGKFYGARSPIPLFEAIESIAAQHPDLLHDVDIELIGYMDKVDMTPYPHSWRLVKCIAPVPYDESLRLMKRADCLLVIDAPAELSVFFPSKLVDYIGAGRHILALTPPGATARIVRQLKGTVADVRDRNSVVQAVCDVLARRPKGCLEPPAAYSPEMTSALMMSVIRAALGRCPVRAGC